MSKLRTQSLGTFDASSYQFVLYCICLVCTHLKQNRISKFEFWLKWTPSIILLETNHPGILIYYKFRVLDFKIVLIFFQPISVTITSDLQEADQLRWRDDHLSPYYLSTLRSKHWCWTVDKHLLIVMMKEPRRDVEFASYVDIKSSHSTHWHC